MLVIIIVRGLVALGVGTATSVIRIIRVAVISFVMLMGAV